MGLLRGQWPKRVGEDTVALEDFCEWYPSDTVVGRDGRSRPVRDAYCLKPVEVGSVPPRCGVHVGMRTGDDDLEDEGYADGRK